MKTLAILPPETPAPQLRSYFFNFGHLGDIHRRLGIAFIGFQGYCITQLRIQHGGGTLAGRLIPHARGVSWEEYLRTELGISDSTASRYIQTWQAMSARIAKLSVEDQKGFLSLLTKPTANYTPDNFNRLRELTAKITTAESQTAFLIECGLIKPPRKDPGSIVRDPANNGADHRSGPNTELIIQDELFGPLTKAGRMIEWWNKTVKIGSSRVPIWQTMTDKDQRDMEQRLNVDIEQKTLMRDQLREARKRK